MPITWSADGPDRLVGTPGGYVITIVRNRSGRINQCLLCQDIGGKLTGLNSTETVERAKRSAEWRREQERAKRRAVAGAGAR
jgi:hypothetical protein